MITIDGKQIKLQIWDTVIYLRTYTGGVVRAVPQLAARGGGGPLKPARSSPGKRGGPVFCPSFQPALSSSPGLSSYSCCVDQMVSRKACRAQEYHKPRRASRITLQAAHAV